MQFPWRQNLTAFIFLMFNLNANASSSLAGTWDLQVEGPRGQSTPTLIIEAQAQANAERTFSGVLEGPRGSFFIQTISVSGNSFTFPIQIKTALGTLELRYIGNFTEQTMSGSIESPRGRMPFEGQLRQQ
jgi:hypothetical protein